MSCREIDRTHRFRTVDRKLAVPLIEFLESLCARLMKAKYFPNGNLLDTAFPKQVSETWKAIMYGLDLLKKGTIWRVGSGTQIKN